MSQQISIEYKRIICTFLVYIMILSLTPVSVVQAEDKGEITFFGQNEILTGQMVKERLIVEGVSDNDTFRARFENVKTIDKGAFDGCGGLTSVTISNVKTIDEGAFNGCSGLTNVTISSEVESIINNPFTKCINMKEIIVDRNNEYYSSIDGVLYYDREETLIAYPAGKTGNFKIPDGVKNIGNYAFDYCAVTGIDIPADVVRIGYFAFNACINLESININKVTNIGYGAFAWCSKLASINVSVENGSYASSNGVLFDKAMSTLISCPPGKSGGYVIPDKVISIDVGAFYSCIGLTSINMAGSVTSISDGAFEFCESLTGVDLPSSLTSIGNSAFHGTKIQDITLPKSVSIFGKNENYGPFAGMEQLESIVFEQDSKTETTIAANAFLGLANKTNVYIPRNVTAISGESGLGDRTTVCAFEGSYAWEYAKNSDIRSLKTLPTILLPESPEPPIGYLYLPYSYTFDSSEGSWLISKPGILWPEGLIIRISDDPDNKRQKGEIYGAPNKPGIFDVTIQATDGNTYPIVDEYTFTIDIKDKLTQTELERIINQRRFLEYLGIYNSTADIYIVDIYNTNPVNMNLKIDYEYFDYIDLWIDGRLQKEGADYSAAIGSTIITLYGKTLGQLNPQNEHVIAAEFKEDKPYGEQHRVAQNFKINVIDRNGGGIGGGSGSGGGSKDDAAKPPVAAISPTTTTPPLAPPPIEHFIDVKAADWFFHVVEWAYEKEIMIGVGQSRFAPHEVITPGIISLTLARMLNVDLSIYSSEDDKWYSAAFAWANDRGLFDGIDDLNYDTPIDRGRLAIALSRLMEDIEFNTVVDGEGSINPDVGIASGKDDAISVGELTTAEVNDMDSIDEMSGGDGVVSNGSITLADQNYFLDDAISSDESVAVSDGDIMSAEEYDAFKMLVQLGIFQGKGDGVMDPRSMPTRAELATIMYRLDRYATELRNRYGVVSVSD